MLLKVTRVRLTGTLSYTWVELFVPVIGVLSGAGGCLFSSPQQKLTQQPVFLILVALQFIRMSTSVSNAAYTSQLYVSSNLHGDTAILLLLGHINS